MNPVSIIVDRLIADGRINLASQVANCAPADLAADQWGEDTDVIVRILDEFVVLSPYEFPDKIWEAIDMLAGATIVSSRTRTITIRDLCVLATLPGWPQ